MLAKRLNAFVQRMFGRSDIVHEDKVYMRRWRLVHVRKLHVRVHNIVRSDVDRDLHDHPFTFVSFILRGGYWEHREDGSRTWYGRGSVLLRKAETLHRLELERPAWTLVFGGPSRRTWGCKTPGGWVDYRTYAASKRARGVDCEPTRVSEYATGSSY